MSQPLGEERRVVPFAAPSGRERRRNTEAAEARGAILLFTGVRYERMPQPPITDHREPVAPRDPRLGA